MSLMPWLIWTVVFAAFHCQLGEAQGVNYTEIVGLGLNCTPVDSCDQKWSRSRDLPSLDERSCACDQLCTLYDDCCVDGPLADPLAPKPFACVQMRNYQGVFMIASCPSNWTGDPEVRKRCEGPYDDSDPVGNLPLTDFNRSITYRNIHCATCHEQSSNLTIWQLRLEFDAITRDEHRGINLSELVLRKPVRQDGVWGFMLRSKDGEEYFNRATVDAAMPPQLETKIRACKPDLRSRCADDWSDQEVRDKCLAYQGVLYVSDRGDEKRIAYRNAHCAVCNREDLSQLVCKSPDQRSLFDFRSFSAVAFSILVDITDKNDGGVGVKVMCPENQIYDVLFKKCRSLSCFSPDQVLKDNQCVFESNEIDRIVAIRNDIPIYTLNLTIFNETSDNETEPAFSPNFVSCSQILLPEEDFIMLSNKSVFIPIYGRVYDSGEFRLWNNGVFVCAPEGSSRLARKFSTTMGYVTVVCLSVSMFFLFLHILFFIIVPDWQNNLSSKNLMSLAFSLFLAYLGFLIAQWHPLPETFCLFLSVEMFYFYLASFFWMNVMAYDVWRTLRMATRELRVNSGRQWCRYTMYSVYGWLIPAGIVCGALIFEFTDKYDSKFKPQFGKNWCWFGSRDSLLVFFALPLAVMMAANIAFFSSSAWMIASTTKATIKHTGNNRRNFRLYWKLAVMLGLSWSFAFLASYLNLETLWYVFVVLNCLKGVFIFVAFTCNGKVKRYLADKMSWLTKRRAYRTSSVNSGSAYNSNSTQPSTNPAFKTSSTDLKSKSVSSL